MPHHACIDPHDRHAQADARVEFQTMAGVVRLVAAHDASDDDILPALGEVRRNAVHAAIHDDVRRHLRTIDGLPRRGPVDEAERVG